MAAELRAVGVDFSFAPCVDLDYGLSEIIGDRAFHRDPQAVAALATAYMAGMREAGMAAVAKHFPGHGAVRADSHVALPVDRRPLADMERGSLSLPAAHREPAARHHGGARRVFGGRPPAGEPVAPLDHRAFCGARSAFTAACSPTISAWRARRRSATSSSARGSRWPRDATCCRSAMTAMPCARSFGTSTPRRVRRPRRRGWCACVPAARCPPELRDQQHMARGGRRGRGAFCGAAADLDRRAAHDELRCGSVPPLARDLARRRRDGRCTGRGPAGRLRQPGLRSADADTPPPICSARICACCRATIASRMAGTGFARR